MVVESTLSLGQVLGVGATVIKYLDTETFYVEAEIKEGALSLLDIKSAKAKTYLISGVNVSPKDASVVGLIPQVDEKSKMIKLLLEIKEPLSGEMPVLSGNSVRVEIFGREIENSVLLPINLLKEGDTIWIYVNDMLEIKKVEPINEQGGAVLLKNINKDEQIITTNLNAPSQGMLLSKKDKKRKREQ